MTLLNLQRFLITSLFYFTICFFSQWLIAPLSFIHVVAPAAAFFSGFILLWGTSAFVAILIFSPIVAWCFQSYLGVTLDLGSMLIALLAIILQGFWTKQLTHKFVFTKKWLKSRKWLFFFLLRLGPLTSLVSASAVIVIAIIDNKVMQGSFLYTFVTSWSTGILCSVFFIPLLLINSDKNQLNLRKRWFVSITSVLGAFTIVLLFYTSQEEQQHHRLDKFSKQKSAIERHIKQEISSVAAQVKSLSAFIRSSDSVSKNEFERFSESILKENSSVRAFEWAPIVTIKNKHNFEKKASQLLKQPFVIKERVDDRLVISTKQKPYYAPLYYIYPSKPNNIALGLDVYSNANNILSMEAVMSSDSILASAPLTLVQDDFTKPGILFSTAIFPSEEILDEQSTNPITKLKLKKVKKIEDLQGFVIAVVQLNDFFLRLSQQSYDKVEFFIQDITSYEPYVLFGKPLLTDNRHTESIVLDIYSRQWRIDISEHKTWFSQDKSWQAWGVIIGGTIGAFIFQLLILMMAAYSSELGQQVELKTRALILAKEKSEHESLAKSSFLQTLNNELRIPLEVINAFAEQLKKKGINNKQVTGITHASSNVEKLLDTIMDLSAIESGNVIVKNDPFDFYGFLTRMESMLKVKNDLEGKSIFFLIDKEVPHYINSDELRIQKLLHVLTQSAQQLFVTNTLRLSIKLHEHKFNSGSLFFVFSHQDEATAKDSDEKIKAALEHDFSSHSTSMAMVKEVCQLLQGNIHLGGLPSGGGVLTASIRVGITTDKQQQQHQAKYFDNLDGLA